MFAIFRLLIVPEATGFRRNLRTCVGFSRSDLGSGCFREGVGVTWAFPRRLTSYAVRPGLQRSYNVMSLRATSARRRP